jgi:hypothetical protein
VICLLRETWDVIEILGVKTMGLLPDDLMQIVNGAAPTIEQMMKNVDARILEHSEHVAELTPLRPAGCIHGPARAYHQSQVYIWQSVRALIEREPKVQSLIKAAQKVETSLTAYPEILNALAALEEKP